MGEGWIRLQRETCVCSESLHLAVHSVCVVKSFRGRRNVDHRLFGAPQLFFVTHPLRCAICSRARSMFYRHQMILRCRQGTSVCGLGVRYLAPLLYSIVCGRWRVARDSTPFHSTCHAFPVMNVTMGWVSVIWPSMKSTTSLPSCGGCRNGGRLRTGMRVMMVLLLRVCAPQ